MRSKVIKPYSIEKAVRAHTWNAKPDRKAAQDELYQVALKYKRYEPVNQIAPGDIISIAMKSDAKKFDRSLKLQVGSNLFDKILESELSSKLVGQEYRLAHPAGEIVYTVGDAKRLIVPAVSNDMVKELGIAGVETPTALLNHYLRESMKKELYDEVYEFIPTLLDQWDYAIEEEDICRMDEYEMERCRGISVFMGMVFDEMTEQELLGAVGCRNIPEFRAMIHEYHQKSLRAALTEALLSDKAATQITPENVNGLYGALIDRVIQCVLNQIKED